jgi:serine phosphatase RsbU (regulator of sigma subunit)/CHASE2 domain-containing sensor protein
MLIIFATEHSGLAHFLDHQVVSPLEFRCRKLLGKSPKMSPKLKIFAFDDLSIKLLGEAYFPHDLWPALIEGINKARPRAILSATQFAFEKKSLKETDLKRIQEIPNLEAPLFSAAIFSPQLLSHRTYTYDDSVWRATPGLEHVGAFDYPEAYTYGPEGVFRSVFKKWGHVYQPWAAKFAPFVRTQKGDKAPHLGLLAARDWQVEESQFFLDGKRLPIDRKGLSTINFLDPDQLGSQIRTMVSLFPKINSGQIGEIILPDDVVLIVGSFGTGASSFISSPFGAIPNSFFLASIANSSLTGDWLVSVDLGFWALLSSGVLGYALGWRVSTKMYLTIIFMTLVCLVFLDIFSFTYLSIKIGFFVPTLALIGSSGIAFNHRLREEQRRKLSTDLEQKTAAVLQRDFLPAPKLSTKYFDLVSHYQAAQAIGGDWYSYYTVDERWFFIHVADVTGHGTPSALCASYAKGAIDAMHRNLGNFSAAMPPLHDIHLRLNDILNREGSDRLLITMMSVAIDFSDHKIWYFNSGHPPGVALHANLQRTSQLRAVGTPMLGLTATFEPTKPISLAFSPGDFLILYTDGLSRAIKKLLRHQSHAQHNHLASTLDLQSAQALQDRLLALNEESRRGHQTPPDDITLVVLHFKDHGEVPDAKQS